MLGICLGAQLLAAAAGARVYPGAHGVEIGWAGVELTEAGLVDPLWAGFSKHFVTFHWHGDSFDIPTGAEVLARSERYIQAFRLGSHAYGVQFHPDEKEHRDLAFRFGDNIARWLNSQPR